MQSENLALVVAATLIAAWAVFFGPDTRLSIAASDAVAAPQGDVAGPSLNTAHVVPADVLGTGVVHWAPLIGDDTN